MGASGVSTRNSRPHFDSGKHRMFPGRYNVAARLSLVSLATALLWLSLSARGQEQDQQKPKDQEGFKIGVEVNMVTVPVTVRKAGGGFIKSLPQNAFRIAEDGEEQEIQLFAQEGVPTR